MKANQHPDTSYYDNFAISGSEATLMVRGERHFPLMAVGAYKTSERKSASIWLATLAAILLHAVILFCFFSDTSIAETSTAETSTHTGTTEFKLSLARARKVVNEEVMPSEKTAVTVNKEEEKAENPTPSSEPEQPPTKTITSTKSPEISEKKTVQPDTNKTKKDSIPQKSVKKTEPVNAVKPAPVFNNKSDQTDDKSVHDELNQIPVSSKSADPLKSWMSALNQKVNRNKQYPRKAIRRGQEGDITLKAEISPGGELIHAEVLSGNKIFHSSSLKTLKRSLPMPPPAGMEEPFTLTLTIRYTLD